jgi:hypothetical protein
MLSQTMQNRLIFLISPPRSGSTLMQRMLGSHPQVFTHPEPHLITPMAYLGYHDTVQQAPYDHINAAEAIRSFVRELPRQEDDYLDALRAYSDTLYGRMLEPSGKRYFLDKTPAYALVLPFLTKLYPHAKYIVLTRHPFAIWSSYANSFFEGSWKHAHHYNPVLERYVPAIASLLRTTPVSMHHVVYEQLVQEPEAVMRDVFSFLELKHDPGAIEYGSRFQAKEGMGDPMNVQRHQRPVTSSVDAWVREVAQDPEKQAFARSIAASLAPEDLALWGYTASSLLQPLATESSALARKVRTRTPLNRYRIQRKVVLALRARMQNRRLGNAVRKLRYYCDVLLRDQL